VLLISLDAFDFINFITTYMALRVVLTGGGSGGHVFPLIAVAKELREKKKRIKFLYIGSKAQFGKQAKDLMAQEEIKTKNILAGKIRRYFSLYYFWDLLKMPIGVVQSLWILLWYMPDVIFSKGGYVSVPVVIAAWIYRIPILTHESDAIPGWANRFIGKMSRYVAVSYPSTRAYFIEEKVVLTGNPIRKELLQGDIVRARERWQFSESMPVILVIGGSQGAKSLNDAVIGIMSDLSHRAQVLHVTGENNYKEASDYAGEMGFKSGRHRYVAVPFLERDEMADAYALADLIISRAGANSLTEIAANKKPAILIPLESQDQPINAMEFAAPPKGDANDYDQMKAYQIAAVGGATVLEEANLGHHLLMGKITELLDQPELRAKMAQQVGLFYHPDAAEKIANGVLLATKKTYVPNV